MLEKKAYSMMIYYKFTCFDVQKLSDYFMKKSKFSAEYFLMNASILRVSENEVRIVFCQEKIKKKLSKTRVKKSRRRFAVSLRESENGRGDRVGE